MFNIVNDSVIGKIKKKIEDLSGTEKDKLLRWVCSSMAFVVHDRIHEQGLKADGSKISDKGYSNAYLKLREKKGRIEGNKVVLSFTHQMELDFSVGATDPIKTNNGYGLGFKDDFNADKSKWMEELYGDGIWDLSPSEEKMATNVAKDYVQRFLQS